MNYTDLIERLRDATAIPTIRELCREAADAIEELERELLDLKIRTCCCCEKEARDD